MLIWKAASLLFLESRKYAVLLGKWFRTNILGTFCTLSKPGPSSPRNIQADSLSISAIRVRWQPPEDPNGGIVKYTIEYQPVGQDGLHSWVDTDDGNKTTKDVTALNESTLYQFRVRAFSKVYGEWSKFVQAKTQGDGMILYYCVYSINLQCQDF